MIGVTKIQTFVQAGWDSRHQAPRIHQPLQKLSSSLCLRTLILLWYIISIYSWYLTTIMTVMLLEKPRGHWSIALKNFFVIDPLIFLESPFEWKNHLVRKNNNLACISSNRSNISLAYISSRNILNISLPKNSPLMPSEKMDQNHRKQTNK